MNFQDRKVIQLCICQSTEDDSKTLVALCSDGTMWEKWMVENSAGEWVQIQSIPKEEG